MYYIKGQFLSFSKFSPLAGPQTFSTLLNIWLLIIAMLHKAIFAATEFFCILNVWSNSHRVEHGPHSALSTLSLQYNIRFKAWFHERFFSAKCEIFRLFLLNCDYSNKLFPLECSQFKRNRRNISHFAEKSARGIRP
jgi:hypothetical protein